MRPANRLAVVDVETTGLGNIDRVVEVAVVLLDPLTLEVLDEFDSLINPQRDVGPTRIHGITASMVSAAPTFEDLARQIGGLLDQSILVAHNLPFDQRFLTNEFKRSQVEADLGEGICTLRVTRQALPVACQSVGIALDDHHRALADARATAELLRRLHSSGMSIRGTAADFTSDNAAGFAPTLRREHVSEQQLPTKIPPLRYALPGGGDAELSYLNMLNRYLDDGVLTVEERDSLRELAELYGLQDEVQDLHQKYIDAVTHAAWRDGVLSELEAAHIALLASSLDLAFEANASSMPQREFEFSTDMRVCFTGEVFIDGREWPRADLHALALRNGFIPVDSVTKKSCDLLVCADTATGSGKARKARDWGIAIMSAEEFVRKIS